MQLVLALGLLRCCKGTTDLGFQIQTLFAVDRTLAGRRRNVSDVQPTTSFRERLRVVAVEFQIFIRRMEFGNFRASPRRRSSLPHSSLKLLLSVSARFARRCKYCPAFRHAAVANAIAAQRVDASCSLSQLLLSVSARFARPLAQCSTRRLATLTNASVAHTCQITRQRFAREALEQG